MKALDLTDQRFGKLVAIKRHDANTKHGSYKWICSCDCGQEIIVTSGNLRSGHTKSCGCRRRPHGYFGTRIYNIWSKMKARCSNPNVDSYKNYGGMGISVCEEWQDFVCFKDWALLNGYKDNLQIDRIENDKDYEPGNCRFVTGTMNNQNKRTTRLSPKKVILIKHLLENSNLLQKQIGNIFGVPQNTISQIKSGHLWSTISKKDWSRG